MGKKRTEPKARPVVMVACANSAVQREVFMAGGQAVASGWDPERAIEKLADCDALIITGGGDVNPALYGQARHREVYGLSADRDLVELGLLGAARTLGMPVLGICRGAQLINVEAGGTLHQHLPDKVKSRRHDCATMPVRTVRGSLVAKALGTYPHQLHLHHQAVRKLAPGFTVTARHDDGTVEAIESTDGRVLGVQFHPESSKGGERVFDLLISAAQRYRRKVRDKGLAPMAPADVYLEAWPVAVDAYVNWEPYVYAASKPAPKPKAKGKPVSALTRESTPVLQLADDPITRRPVAWCSEHGIPFDNMADYVDHCDLYGE